MNKFLNRAIWLIIIAPFLYLAISWKNIPEKVAMHFDLQGNPDQFGNKSQLWVLAGVIAVVSSLVFLLLTNMYKIDPKKHAAENKDRLLRIAFTVAVFTSGVSIMMIHAATSSGGVKFNMRFVFVGMGFLWAILGNYLHNIKPNYFAGLRLPWTLENEDNWRQTHQLGSKLWFTGGLVVIAAGLLLKDLALLLVMMIIITVLVIVPIVYSYRLYAKTKNQNK